MIYVIRAGDTMRYKIGYTGRPIQSRLAELQAGSPEVLNLIMQIEGGEDLERELHTLFAYCHSHGEWFSFTDKELEILRRYENVHMTAEQLEDLERALIVGDTPTYFGLNRTDDWELCLQLNNELQRERERWYHGVPADSAWDPVGRKKLPRLTPGEWAAWKDVREARGAAIRLLSLDPEVDLKLISPPGEGQSIWQGNPEHIRFFLFFLRSPRELHALFMKQHHLSDKP